MCQDIQRIVFSGEIVFDALHDQWAAMRCLFRPNFIDAEPGCTYDASVKFSFWIEISYAPGKGEAQVGGVVVGCIPVINPCQRFGQECVAGFFQYFATACVNDGFPWFQMTGRLIESYVGSVRSFLYQQILTVLFDDSGNCDIRFPDHIVEW
jgi:hypothetical protein